MKSKIREILALVIVVHVGVVACLACGPNFPNTFLDSGDNSILAAPVLDFAAELARMKFPAPPFAAVPPTNSFAEQSRDADLADLRVALTKANLPEDQREQIINEQTKARKKLEDYSEKVHEWKILLNSLAWEENHNPKHVPRPEFAEINLPDGLPPEFAEYFRGILAWRRDKTNEARAQWQALLQRPEAERRYRTTWAIFMLGRSFAGDEPDQALEQFQHLRSLIKKGFPDPLGLAESSLGWEAKVYLKQTNFVHAFALYLQQYAAGEPTAVNSLRVTAADAIRSGPETLQTLAKDSVSRRAITAWIISCHNLEAFNIADSKNPTAPWLAALDMADMHDVEEGEQLALAAYRAGDMPTAQRWINRSLSAPLSQWLQAKLYLRAGKPNSAAEILAHLSALFPVQPQTNEIPVRVARQRAVPVPGQTPPAFEDSLYMEFPMNYPEIRTVPSQLLGELGALQLGRREYRESLDCLLRAGCWMDASYVAECVLTVDELKAYVDQNWPTDTEEEATENANAKDGEYPVRSEIRYLLARRLTCVGRGHEARAYYPPGQQTNLDNYLAGLDASKDESRSTEDRARSLFAAAKVARETGMELLGTELYPDYHIHNGYYTDGLTPEERTVTQTNLLTPTTDELARCRTNHPNPDFRFHYRYVAASLAWQAASFMPNNSDETAKMLWTGGTWLKDRDPTNADMYYKALVRRCRKTALGEEADRIRWFPKLDESGKIIPGPTRRKEKLPPGTPSVETDAPPLSTPTVTQ